MCTIPDHTIIVINTIRTVYVIIRKAVDFFDGKAFITICIWLYANCHFATGDNIEKCSKIQRIWKLVA